jgi:hypothetical protein
MAEIPDLIVVKSAPFDCGGNTGISTFQPGGRRKSKRILCGMWRIEMWSMWNAPSDRDYYGSLGADRDEDEPDICGDCGARLDRGEACEDWCATNRAEPEPVPVSRLAVEEQQVNFFEEAGINEVPRLGHVPCGIPS